MNKPVDKRTASQKRFLAAGVPRTCWQLSCVERGQANIPEWAKEQKRRQIAREGIMSAYVLHPLSRREDDFIFCQETVDLLARHAVIEGMSVRVAPFHHLLHTMANPDLYSPKDYDPETPARTTVFDILGEGVIVIPLLPTPEEADCSPETYRNAIDFLLTHLYEGGSLIVGGTQNISKRLASGYPPSFERLLLGCSDFFGMVK